MAAGDITNELMYEQLKAIRGELAELKPEVRSMGAEMRAIKGHLAALVISDTNRDLKMAEFGLRLERVEARLNLREGA
jgi:DNA anti-recombination protein RmuC